MAFTHRGLLAVAVAMAAMVGTHAQVTGDAARREMKVRVVDERVRTDTLRWQDRVALRTNFFDWTLLTPNMGIEIDLGRTNWSRWAIGFSGRLNWNTDHTFKPGIVYNIAGLRAEVRNYWRPKQIDGREVRPHKRLIDRLFSTRRKSVKHPSWAFYRGVYASYTDFSIKLGSEGKQGSALTVGGMWGFVKPLYIFRRGNSLDLEVGISAGVAYAKYDTYGLQRESNCYNVTQRGTWQLVKHPVVSDIRVGLVYRIGRYPSTHKYRWRYDVDTEYADRVRAKAAQQERERIDKQTSDSITRLIDRDFRTVYERHAAINKREADKQRQADKRAKAAKKAEEKAAAEAKKAQEKAAAEAKKAEEKAAAEAKKAEEKAAAEAKKAEEKAAAEAKKAQEKAAAEARGGNDKKEDEQ